METECQNKKSLVGKIILSSVFTLMAGALFLILIEKDYLNEKIYEIKTSGSLSSTEINKLKKDVFKLESRIISTDLKLKEVLPPPPSEARRIDLTLKKFQRLNEIFFLMISEVAPCSDGIKIKGEIFNQSSITHKNIVFNVNINGRSREILIKEPINPGYARDFEVSIPNISPKEAKFATVEFVESTIEYYKH